MYQKLISASFCLSNDRFSISFLSVERFGKNYRRKKGHIQVMCSNSLLMFLKMNLKSHVGLFGVGERCWFSPKKDL